MKKKRSIALIIICFSAISAYTQETLISLNPIKSGEVIINGHINKYKGIDKTGNLIFVDAVARFENQEVFSIDSNGNFKTTFDLACPTMISYLQLGRTIFFLYLEPGETYNLIINENGTHTFTGENGTINNQIFELNEAIKSKFKKEMDKLNQYYRSDQTDFQSFEKFCDDLAKMKLAFVEDYCKKNGINQNVRDLIKLDLNYEPACNLLSYRFISSNTSLIKRKGLPLTFYQNIFDKYQINNPNAIASRYYVNYLTNIRDLMWEDYYLDSGFFTHLKNSQLFSDRELFLISKKFENDTTITKTKEFTGFYDEHRADITKLINKYLTIFLLDSIASFPSGLGRDLIISQSISYKYLSDQTFSPAPEEWARIESLISNKSVIAQLRKVDQFYHAKAFIPTNTKTTFLTPFLKNEADRIFEKLIGKYNSKVIYIDFWATWCGPCKKEIPFSKVLSSHYNDKDVVFLYLCCQSDKKNWENTIKSDQMTGDHYLLSTDEYNVLTKLFKIKGVPTYVLINKKGNIINKNAPRPSQGPMTIAAIDKLLKQ
jgi:thiol-disulfide isomerase/thioredoxin